MRLHDYRLAQCGVCSFATHAAQHRQTTALSCQSLGSAAHITHELNMRSRHTFLPAHIGCTSVFDWLIDCSNTHCHWTLMITAHATSGNAWPKLTRRSTQLCSHLDRLPTQQCSCVAGDRVSRCVLAPLEQLHAGCVFVVADGRPFS